MAGLQGGGAVPAHVGDFQMGALVAGVIFKTKNSPFDHAEASDARRFFAVFKKELVADADPKVRLVGFDPFLEWSGEPEAIEAAHAVAERTLARTNEVAELREMLGRGDDAGFVSKRLAGIDHGAKISTTVVNDAKFHR